MLEESGSGRRPRPPLRTVLKGSGLRGNCYQQIGLNLLMELRVMATYTPICYKVATRNWPQLLPKLTGFEAHLMKVQARFGRTNSEFGSKLVASMPKSA